MGIAIARVARTGWRGGWAALLAGALLAGTGPAAAQVEAIDPNSGLSYPPAPSYPQQLPPIPGEAPAPGSLPALPPEPAPPRPRAARRPTSRTT